MKGPQCIEPQPDLPISYQNRAGGTHRFAGQQRDLELGSAFDVSLVKARDLRDDARTLMRQGSLTPIIRYL